MSIMLRGGVYHYDFTVDGQRYRHSTEQTTKKAALRVEARDRERAKLGDTSTEIPTLRKAGERWFAARAEGRRSSVTTAHRLKIAMRHIDPGLLVSEVTTAIVEEALQARRFDVTHNGRAPTNSTVNRDMIDSTLRPILNYAAEIYELPMRKIAWAKIRLVEPKTRSHPFPAAKFAAWRAELPEWHRPLHGFLALYGVRLREAFFPPEAVDPEAGEVTIKGKDRKNGEDLVIPLLEEDAADLAARASRAHTAGLTTVWYRDVGGVLTPIHPRGFQAASKAALVKVGMGEARPAHDLRHHAGTAVRRSGDLTIAQMLLGHEDIKSSARYSHPDKDALRAALRHAKDAMTVSEPISLTISKAVTGT